MNFPTRTLSRRNNFLLSYGIKYKCAFHAVRKPRFRHINVRTTIYHMAVGKMYEKRSASHIERHGQHNGCKVCETSRARKSPEKMSAAGAE